LGAFRVGNPLEQIVHLAIDQVPFAQAALLKKFGKSNVYDFFAEIDFRHELILQIIAQLLVRSWDNGWDSRNGSRCVRITFKVRQGNDLVEFEPFVRSQTLYPTELRARSKHFTVNSLRQVLLRFQP